MEKGFIFSLIFAAIVAVFALSNADKVLIDLLFVKVEISQAIVIFISTILGAVIVALLGMVKTFKLKKEIKELNKEMEPLEEEVNNLKSLVENRGEEIKELNTQLEELEGENGSLQSRLKEKIEEMENFKNSLKVVDLDIENGRDEE